MKPHLALKQGPKTYHGVVIAFLLVQLLIIVRNWVTDYWLFYWFCDFAPLVFALCFARGNLQAAKGLMYIGLIGQLIYATSFFSLLFFNIPFLGVEIPVINAPLDSAITAIMHVTTLAAFFITLNEKPQPKAILYSLGFLIVMYGTVIIFTTPHADIGLNYNYIYSGGTLSLIPYYTFFWIPLVFTFVVLPTYWCDRKLYIKNNTPDPQIRG